MKLIGTVDLTGKDEVYDMLVNVTVCPTVEDGTK